MIHRILLKTSFCFFQFPNLLHKCLPKAAKNSYDLTYTHFRFSKRSFYVSCQCCIKNKRRRAPEPIVLKIKSSKKILELYEDINLKYYIL